MSSDDLAAEPSPPEPPRRANRVPWGRWVVAAYLGLLVGAVALYETPDAARRRRLATVHARAAVECRRAERTARASGRVEEASRLSRTARNHDWFADAYRGVVRKPER